MRDVVTYRVCGEWLSQQTSLCLFLCLLTYFPACGWANDEPSSSHIHLDAQPMAQSLNALSEVYSVSFAVNSKDIETIMAKPLQGYLSLEQALAQLLRDTPLSFSQFGNGFIIEKKSEVKQVEPATSAEELVVYGFRHSIKYARDIKKEAIDIVDLVASAEFAQYPDLNLAESLQRLPGITITREAGEGRLVSLRGISPEFTLVTLNGMPVLANNDSPMDSRGQKQRDRSFDFNIFSTDLFEQAAAKKSYSADQISGGIAGTIALKTARPFDQPGLNISSAYQAGINEYTDGVDSRGSVLISNTLENWGGLFSLSYSERDAQERGANTFRWRNISIDDADLSDLPDATQDGLINGEYFIPRGNRYSVWTKTQERLGLGGVLQYDSARHKMSLDLLYGELSAHRKEYHLYPRGSQSTPIISGETRLLEAEVNNNNELVFARYSNARTAVESRHQYVATDYQQAVFNAKHRLSSRISLRWLLGTEQSKFDLPFSNKVYMQGVSDVAVDYRQDRFYADISYENSNLLHPDNWTMSEIDQEKYSADTTYNTLMLSTKFNNNDYLSLEVGGEHVQFINTAFSLFNDDLFKEEWAAFNDSGQGNASGINNRVPTQFTRPLLDHPKQDWLVLDTNPTLRYYGINPYGIDDPEQNVTSRIEGDLDESSSALYIASFLDRSPFSAKAAVRYQVNTTDISFDGSRTLSNTWRVLLPSINIVWDSQKNWIAKVGMSRNITKPFLADLSSAPGFDLDDRIVYDENSELLPYSANNLDISVASYWSTSDLFSISAFFKDIEDYIVSRAKTLPYGDTGIANYWQDSPFSDDEVITQIKKENADAAEVYGLEVHLQHQFDYLPYPWRYFGVDVQASLIKGEVSYYNDNTGEKLFDKPLPFLSENSGALTLYYEAPKLSCRLSTNYRSRYIYRVDSDVLSDEDENGFHSTLYIDAQLGYRLSPQWQLKLEAFNLSDQREVQYSDSANRPYNTASSGRSLYLGVSFNY